MPADRTVPAGWADVVGTAYRVEPATALRPVDTATLFYLLLSGCLAAIFLYPSPAGGVLALCHGAAAMAIPFVLRFVQRNGSRWMRFLRDWYPTLIFFVLYEETAMINKGSFVPSLDPWLSRMDDLIFGAQLSEALPELLSPVWFQEWMAASYFSYYLIIPGAGLYLWFRNRERFTGYIFTLAACFYFCYLLFILLPAGGPQQYLADGRIHWDGVLFGPLLTGMLGTLEVDTGAFPSSHVAIALITVVFVWREKGYAGWIFSILFAGLFLATVYGGPHYALDLPAGLLVGSLFLVLSERLYKALDRTTENGA